MKWEKQAWFDDWMFWNDMALLWDDERNMFCRRDDAEIGSKVTILICKGGKKGIEK